MAAADSYMADAALPPMRKYPSALRAYRKVLELDPSNQKAKENVTQIEAIYKSTSRWAARSRNRATGALPGLTARLFLSSRFWRPAAARSCAIVQAVIWAIIWRVIIDPKSIPARVAYQILIGAVIPRPIGFISSVSAEGVVNLAPFSFFNAICAEPPMLMFCVSNRHPAKDTLLNVKATGEFVANIVSQEIARQMNLASGDYSPDVNEFDVSGLSPLPSQIVKPPCVKESPVSMECMVRHIIEVSDQPLGATVVIGEVVLFHVRDSIIDKDMLIDPGKLNPIARLGGPSYSTIQNRFDMIRPVVIK